MDKIYIIPLLLILFSLGIVSAQQDDIRFYHERATNLTIYEKCRFDGSVCEPSLTCFLSVISTEQILILNNQTMNDGGVYWNFTLNETQTEVNGIYESTVDCSNETIGGSNTFFYEITPDGSPPINNGQSLILFSSILFMILLVCFFGYMGFRSRDTTIQLSFLAFSILLMVFTLGMIVNVIELSFGTFSEIISNYETIYILFTVLIIVGSIGLMVYLIWVALNYYWGLRGFKDTISVKT